MKNAFLFMTIFSLFSCFNSDNKTPKKVDRFYVSKGSYDAIRIPLIKPYELIKLNGSNEWSLNLVQIPGSVSNIEGISVKGDFIFLYSGESYCNNEKVKESWVIIDTQKKIEQCFSIKKNFETQIEGSPNFREPDVVYKEFNDNNKIIW